MDIITQKTAKTLGLKRYYTGKPCKWGHFSERFVSKGACITCHNRDRAKQRLKNPEREKAYKQKADARALMLYAARYRAKQSGVPCTITTADIVIPQYCPVLGIRLTSTLGRTRSDGSPSLDKFNPTLGYVPGNVSVISHRANTLKNNGTLDEFLKLVEWMNSRTSIHDPSS